MTSEGSPVAKAMAPNILMCRACQGPSPYRIKKHKDNVGSVCTLSTKLLHILCTHAPPDKASIRYGTSVSFTWAVAARAKTGAWLIVVSLLPWLHSGQHKALHLEYRPSID